MLGHLAKFVKPGAVRVDSTGYGQGGVENVAFRNPDGSIVLVAVNSGGAQNFQVSYGGSSFGYQLPAGAMATFTWPGAPVTPTSQPWLPASLGGGAFRFTTRNSGKCLDVRDVSTADGALLQQWSCTGGGAQSFRLVAVG